MDNVIVSLENVSRTYDNGKIEAVTDLSLQVTRGEFVALLGASGSGKTTLLNLMTGLDAPTTGRVRFNGAIPATRSRWCELRSRHIGFIFQSFNLLPTLTAFENIEIPMFGNGMNAGQRQSRANELLERVGLSQRASHLPSQLSGGERQRVAIARSLANRPTLFVPEYWDPVRLFNAPLGIEDILFSFSTGMIAWTIGSLFITKPLVPAMGMRMVLRYAKVLGMGVAMIALMQLTAIRVMTQALTGIVCISCFLTWNRFRLLPAALGTGAIFAFFYTGFLAVMLMQFPGLFSYWTHANLYGVYIIGIPMEEILWSFVFGACWVMFMAYMLDLELSSESI